MVLQQLYLRTIGKHLKANKLADILCRSLVSLYLVEVTRVQTCTGQPEEKLEFFEDLYPGLKACKHNINLGLLIVTAFTWTKYFPSSD